MTLLIKNYMAIDKEGRFVAVIAGTASSKHIAKETGKWIREGMSVERCEDEYVRQHFGDIVKNNKEAQEMKGKKRKAEIEPLPTPEKDFTDMLPPASRAAGMKLISIGTTDSLYHNGKLIKEFGDAYTTVREIIAFTQHYLDEGNPL